MSDLYEKIIARIIEQLNQGVVPWKSPYFSTVGFPKNFATQKEYRGINVLLLGSQRFTSPYFMTFLQAKELGGAVRKGERGHLVVKYETYLKEDEHAQEDDPAKLRGYLKGYTVFHSSQIDGIDFPESAALPELTTTEKTDRARAIIDAMPQRPPIIEGSAVPCYRPHTDTVHMPEKRFFTTEESYFSTIFHEFSHSTGHVSRLARKSLMENKGFDATDSTYRKFYAEEELVAEMAASFLNAHAGIFEEEIENSAAYLQSWINALQGKDAKAWIIRAASQGQKAADFILGRSLALDTEGALIQANPTPSGSFTEKLKSSEMRSGKSI